MSADDIYSQPLQRVPDFVFDDKVADVFSDMINRSVPGYATITAVTGVLAERFSQANTNIYDLGCSLGATTFAIASVAAEGCQCVAVDNSAPMIEKLNLGLKKNLGEISKRKVSVRPVLADVLSVSIENASMVAMNFTLQFLSIDQRAQLLQKICAGLNDGGILVLSEKIKLADNITNDLYTDLHHCFKRNNGYSELEISQKRDAIENILIPESLESHKQRLLAAGFARVEVWFQCFNFVSLVAFR